MKINIAHDGVIGICMRHWDRSRNPNWFSTPSHIASCAKAARRIETTSSRPCPHFAHLVSFVIGRRHETQLVLDAISHLAHRPLEALQRQRDALKAHRLGPALMFARLSSLVWTNYTTCHERHAAVVPPRTCLLRNKMSAFYDSKCSLCLKKIDKGEWIAKANGGFLHSACAALSLHGLNRLEHGLSTARIQMPFHTAPLPSTKKRGTGPLNPCCVPTCGRCLRRGNQSTDQ